MYAITQNIENMYMVYAKFSLLHHMVIAVWLPGIYMYVGV